MALLLPVLRREAAPVDVKGVDMSDCEDARPMGQSSSTSSLASTSASDEIHYSVKNTFIDVSPADSEDDRPNRAFHNHGVRTCLARIASDDSPQKLLGQIGLTGVPDDVSPVVFTPTPRFHTDAAGLDLTRPQQLLAASLMPAIEEDVGRTTPPQPMGIPPRAAEQVIVQIPLELVGGAPALEAVHVDVSDSSIDAATGNVVLNLRVTLSAPTGCVAAATGAEPSDFSTAPQRLGTLAAGASVSPGKCSAVCRHWKSKGWCNYRDSCKFQHPASSRGVDLPTVEHLPAPAARKRGRDSRPRRQPLSPVPAGPLQ